jgi:RNA polymerase sigma factor (sigma-70 family)
MKKTTAPAAFDYYLKDLKDCEPLSRKEEQRKYSIVIKYRDELYQAINRNFINHHFPEFRKKEEAARNGEASETNKWALLHDVAPLYFICLHLSSLKQEPGSPKYKRLENKKSQVFRAYMLWHMAKEEFIEANLRLGIPSAKKYARGHSLEDSVARANDGMMRAVDSFDPSMGYKFSTYASLWMRQAVERGITENELTIRLPAHLNSDRNKIIAIRAKLERKNGGTTLEELAKEAEMEPDYVEKALEINPNAASLDAAACGSDEDYESWSNFMEDPNSPNAAEESNYHELHDLIEKVLPRYLRGKELDIIKSRFGLGGNGSSTLKKIAQKYGLSRERIRQLETVALRKLSGVPEFQEFKPVKFPLL